MHINAKRSSPMQIITRPKYHAHQCQAIFSAADYYYQSTQPTKLIVVVAWLVKCDATFTINSITLHGSAAKSLV